MTTAPATTSGYLYSPSVESYSVTPSVRLSLPSGWEMSLSGTLGRSLTEVESRSFSGGALASVTRVAYDNQIQSIELRGDGNLVNLTGGDRKSTRLNPVTNAHLVCRILLEK